MMAWHVQAAVPAEGMKNHGHRLLPNSAHESPKTRWNANDSRKCEDVRNTAMMTTLPTVLKTPPTSTISATVVS